MIKRTEGLVWVGLIGFAICTTTVRAAEESPPSGTVLATKSLWRSFTYWSPAVMGTAKEPTLRRGPIPTAPPPTNWLATAFDDSMWERLPGPYFGVDSTVRRQVGGGLGQSPALAMLLLRARFGVADPVRVTALRLSMAYRGGVVVYLNGQEVARAHLPGGALGPDSLAEDYPMEAYRSPQGALVGSDNGPQCPETLAKRTRRMDVTLPPAALRKGANVLAIEIHRAALLQDIEEFPGGRADWNTVAMEDVSLVSNPAGSAVPPVSSASVAVANAGPFAQVTDEWYADMFEPLQPLHLVAPRNGVASGQVVLSGKDVLDDAVVTVGDLKGPGTIPATAVQIRYGMRTGSAPGEGGRMDYPWYDVLTPVRPQGAKTMPVWVTVQVPSNAAAGNHQGVITVKAKGDVHTVPLRLRVAPWVAPAPRDMTPHVGLIQSPETVARRYGVPLWSDAHFVLLKEGFRLLGEVGAKVAHVTFIAKTHFGNDQSMLRWKKTAAGVEPDFTIVDRYLALWSEQVGAPQVLCLYVWDYKCGGQAGAIGWVNTGKEMETKGGKWAELPVTMSDGSDGVAPTWTNETAATFWRPAFDGILARVRTLGWDDKCVMLGIGADSRPNLKQLAFFKTVAPNAPWVLRTHTATPDISGYPVGCSANEGAVGPGPCSYLATVFPRDYHPYEGGSAIGNTSPPWTYRQVVLGSFVRTGRTEGGIGGVGADFWPVDSSGPLYDRHIGWGHLSLKCTTTHLLAPGPSGALATQRYEMLREGLQEAQAFTELLRATQDPAKRARLGPLAAEAERAMDHWRHQIAGFDGPREWYVNAPWQEWTYELFTMAGKIKETVDGQ